MTTAEAREVWNRIQHEAGDGNEFEGAAFDVLRDCWTQDDERADVAATTLAWSTDELHAISFLQRPCRRTATTLLADAEPEARDDLLAEIDALWID